MQIIEIKRSVIGNYVRNKLKSMFKTSQEIFNNDMIWDNNGNIREELMNKTQLLNILGTMKIM